MPVLFRRVPQCLLDKAPKGRQQGLHYVMAEYIHHVNCYVKGTLMQIEALGLGEKGRRKQRMTRLSVIPALPCMCPLFSY